LDAQGPEDEQRQVAPGIVLSASRELTLQTLQSPPSARARVLVGYAGWGPGQLDQEIAASGWLTMDVDPALIFGMPAEQMWDTAIRRLGADPAAFQTSPGVH
jgi:putative transcriptional regulator